MLKVKHSRLWAYLYIAPLMLFIFVYMLYPIIFNFKNSFFEWNGFGPNEAFIGLQNYIDLFKDPVFFTVLKNFVIFGAVTVFMQAFFGLIFAVLLQNKFAGRDLIKAIMFMPAVLSAVVIGNIFFRILEPNTGILNSFLKLFGMNVVLLGDMRFALWTIIVVQIWQWTGYSMTMYYAGIQSIPTEMYEAAQLDGAGWWKILFKITFPMLRGTTYGLTILGIIGVLKTFDLPYTMTKGGPAESTQFFSTYMYDVTFNQYKQGYACALAVIMFLIALIVTIIQLKLYNKNQVEY